MPPLSLGTRLAVIVILGSISTVGAVLAVAYNALVDDFEAILTEQQLVETRRIATEVEQRLKLKLDVLSESAAMMSDGNALHSLTEITYQLERQNLLHTLFPDGLVVFDAEATAIAENIHAPGRLGTNYSDRNHFRRAIQTRSPVISRPLLGRATGVPLLSFLAPIESGEGDLLGLLSGTVTIGQTSLIPDDMLKRLRDEQDRFKVIDVENLLYIEGGPSPGQGVQPLPVPGADPLVDAGLSGITFGTVTDNNGQEQIYAASHLEDLGWMFIRSVPYERATAPAFDSFMKFSIISIAIGFFIALLGFLASRSAVKPLDKMTETIEGMARSPSNGQRLTGKGTKETRQLAAAFNQLMTERDAISTMKENFVSNVSHELRTPLTSLNGALRLLASGAAGALPVKAEEMARLALRNGDRLHLLISDLLDFSKLTAGQMTVSLAPQPLEPVIEAAMIDNTALASEHNLSLVIEGLGDQVIVADEHRLRQVLDNFISNAIKFSPSNDTITLKVEQSGPETTRIIVSDCGSGVPKQFESELFERFSQAEVGTSKSIKGTGLGLAICQDLARLMNGKIGYFYDSGANFWIELPNSTIRKNNANENAGISSRGA
ncbi:ATP-binding protein [Marinobacter sp. F3R08]|uniref:sensor histidine kinase n=1 Tax=Marinobacter sp. F3R08 TaxID=2841559 RepID=UPI001C0A441B|nr:ATP-binding protein [Marinobacter sp. F3R08]MBU2953135.1 HAMP domain-containing protein [Marinobacter sp. F3R08]